mmetsp:Transcript_101826/g.328480  ORF Transcript_101826/g.328480 Transcript_101826/m.328480 type:complete len:244 (-) Transcript_101826:181-912(-)
MPLADGTNDEKEDPQPALEWKSKDDLKDVVLYQALLSPPCAKIRCHLIHYGVAFTTKTVSMGKPIKPGASYKKVPVMTVGKRTVNDSYVIVKHMVPIASGQPLNEEWEQKITYKLQPSIELECFGNVGDLTKFACAMGFPKCIVCCIAPTMSKRLPVQFRKTYPDLPAAVDIGKEFHAAMGFNNFFGGEQPGPVDVSYYGTCLTFMYLKLECGHNHIEGAGLKDWWQRMEAVIPTDKIFPPKK